ncbi:MAG: hypothetical protein PHR66_08585, partial [Desulfuromonadaceae bacterium]|nr:hypothetical protein [Desulfuromonadaceae bacterium]
MKKHEKYEIRANPLNSKVYTFSHNSTCNSNRVGQILVDEIINYCDVPKAKRMAAQRCLISDMNPDAIKRSLND